MWRGRGAFPSLPSRAAASLWASRSFPWWIQLEPGLSAGAATIGAAALEAAELGEDDEAVELVDVDAVELADVGFSAPCTAAVSAVLTRSRAVWLAMLARPVASVVDAPNIWLMTAELSACAWLPCCVLAQ